MQAAITQSAATANPKAGEGGKGGAARNGVVSVTVAADAQ
jgi:hypothetical protein